MELKLGLRSKAILDAPPIRRSLEEGFYQAKDVFPGLASSPILKAALANLPITPEEVLVEVASSKTKYMRVSERDGRIIVDREHLRNASSKTLYLDLLHEMVHVRQFLEGKDLYDDYYDYVDRPLEIEAYALTVCEARRLGMLEEEIIEYLRLDWVTGTEHARLARNLGVLRS